MDDELQILRALKLISKQKAEAEAQAEGVAPVLSDRKSWLEFKRRNAMAWSEATIASCGSQHMRIGSGLTH